MMINKSNSNERAEFISQGVDGDSLNRQFIEAPLAAARQSAIGTGLDLLAFMSALPDAFIASEKRELKRLSRSSDDKNDPRIERLKISIESAGELRSTANLGKARLERGLVSMSEDGNVFHGFVSDTELRPREKLVVRISAVRDGEKSEKSLSATTDADGYFSISLGKDTKARQKTGAPESSVTLSERMNELLMRVNAKADTAADSKAATDKTASAAGEGKEILARVEILDASGKILHQDSSALVVNAGTAYREYAIDDNEAVKTHDLGSYADMKTSGAEKPEANNPKVNPVAAKPAGAPAAKTAGKKPAPGKKK